MPNHSFNLPLSTPRLTLLPMRPSDRPAFINMMQASIELHRPWFPALPAGETFDDFFNRQLAKAQAGLADGSAYRFLAHLPDGRIAGTFNLFHIIRDAFHSATAGWSINAQVARQGLATEAVGALLDFAFSPAPAGLALHRVQANIVPTNLPSIRVAEKNHFRREGLGLRYLKINNKWQDHLFFAKLAEEHLGIGSSDH